MRALPAGLHDLAALVPGDHWETGTVEVTPAMVGTFAELTGDLSGLHLCDAEARRAGFAGRVAHGLLVLSLIEGLKARAPVQIATHTALAWEVTFRAPVLVGESLSARLRVQAVRRTGDKGMVTLAVEGRTDRPVLLAAARYFGHFTR